ncbi:MAG: HAD family phosphatase [candidate division WOR-3 bacterium]|nr:MAG: HAD family phosphatase [candidate division WOR-3 bacterium]
MKQYRAIIFDCGGVIFDFSPANVFKHWAMVGNEDPNTLEHKFKFSEVYLKFERGEIDSSAFRAHTLNMLELKINEEEFDRGWNNLYGDLVPGIEELLSDLQDDYRLVALTNTNEIHARKWQIICRPLLHYFEKVFSSHEIHARKPERKAYEIVLKYLDLAPDDVIFLDDNPQFVRAAAELQIKAIQVNSFKQMVSDLRNLGVEVRASHGL